MKTILIDLDGPLANLEDRFLEIWRERHPNEYYIPFEERRQLYISKEYPDALKSAIDAILLEKDFFLSFKPVPGAIEAVTEIESRGDRVFICSSPLYPSDYCLNEKKLWVAKYLGEDIAHRAIFTKDKTLVKGDYLIDDNPTIVGAAVPEWKQVVYDQPFNTTVTDLPRLNRDWSNWKDVIR